MAKKKHRIPKVPNISEDVRIRLTQMLENFRQSSDEVFTFEPNLSKRDRAAVHLLCRKMGMKSKSTGRSQQRYVRVYKVRKKVTESQNLSNLSFSGEAKEVLRNLFTHYPPDDGEEGKEMDGKNGEKFYDLYQKRDGIFCKPLMSKAEIAKKLESLASRMENVLNLRQINEVRSKLPIASFRDVITSTVESHQVVLVSGETGCGKTTQVPQYLLDYMWGKGKACKIVCTQPRRISALSVAERISCERGQDIGDDVGYKIRLESKGGRHSSIVFCTNGVLLRVLIARGAKAEVSKKHKKLDLCDMTHIIVDEIHERDRFSDFMLAILRDMLPSYPHLRLILMSATLDAERFSQYFGGCPIIRVPGFTYPVKTFYLEDVLSILRSPENNHLSNTILSVPSEESKLTEEDKLALDEAIDLAWSNDEFDPLLELISSEGTAELFNYQHSSSGLTALMVFARKGRVGDVCMLLSLGANSQLRAKDGTTAIEGAERDGQLETAEILKKHMESHFSNSMEEQQLLDKYFAEINPEFIDDVLIEQLLVKICTDSEDGAILVFLPGWDDINKIRERLLMNPLFNNTSKFVIISLHSKVPSVEQKKAFKQPPRGCRKIVLSTNIAETAVTIDDVVYVIDTGRMKEKSYDPYNNVSTLQSSWVSKASAKQREGRAGRCQPGICYHLYSKLRAASFPEFQVPEIKRMPIEELCLQVKLLDPDCKIEDFLQKTMDPPIFESIRNAVVVLQDIGALSLDERLTELGEKLGSLPVHPLTSKMLFFAILVNCLDPALTLACAADYRDPFTLPMLPNERKKAAAAKSELALLFGGHSDQLAVIAAFECWKNAKERGQEARFCSQYFVSSSTMHMLSGMRKQLQMELIRLGFISGDVSSYSLNASDSGILHAVLVAGLYPMVGRLLFPNKNMKRLVIETDSGDKVRLHHQSTISKLSFNKTDSHALVIFDEITRGDGGMNIRNCTLIGPLPLLLFSTEIAVAPTTNGDDDNDDDNDDDDDDDDGSDDNNEDGSDEDAMDMDNKSAEKHREKIMSSPDNSVVVIVDRWLRFGSTALDVAQIYCLRERLAAAILFKVTHPREALPPLLAASAYAIALILSYDGMSGMYLPSESLDSKMSKVKDNEIDKSEGGKVSPHHSSMAYLRSLLHRGKYQNPLPHHVTTRSQGQAISKNPLSYNGQASVNQAYVNPHGMPLSGNLSFGGHGRVSNGRFVPGDSHKRLRGNGAGQ